MNSGDLGANADLQDEGVGQATPPEEAIPGTPANNLLSYGLIALLAIFMIVVGLAICGSMPVVDNNQPLPGRAENHPGR